jgi:Tfp pilus assembly protein PilZ
VTLDWEGIFKYMVYLKSGGILMKKLANFFLGLALLITVTVNGQLVEYYVDAELPQFDLPFEH